MVFPRAATPPLRVSFDCYREARYRKSKAVVPDFRIMVVDYSSTLPDASQLARLEQDFPDKVTGRQHLQQRMDTPSIGSYGMSSYSYLLGILGEMTQAPPRIAL